MQRPLPFGLTDVLNAARSQGRSDQFVASLKFELIHEGVIYEVVQGDAGGPTSAGLVQSDYDAYRKSVGNPTRPVSQITPYEVAAIYWHQYWLPIHGEDVCYPTDEVLNDCAVNMGIGVAVKIMQGVLGVPQDGQFGPQTMGALDAYVEAHGQAAFINAYIIRRDARYDAIGAANSNDLQFERGWHSRDADLLADAQAALAKGNS